MKQIAIVGGGALGRQLLDLLGPISRPPVIFDDGRLAAGEAGTLPFAAFLDERFRDADFYVGLGYRHLARKLTILRALHAAGRRLPSLVHPSACIDASSHLEDGCVIYPLCNVGAHVRISIGALLNNSTVISHESSIGGAAYLSPAVVLSGRVTIGESAFLGAGVIVSNGCRVGAGSRIGIGSVVTQDVPDGSSAIGNPLRVLDRPLELE
jgi:sugar O-acyltransferase (sialic acid O-acetyltransferase NeuD family)